MVEFYNALAAANTWVDWTIFGSIIVFVSLLGWVMTGVGKRAMRKAAEKQRSKWATVLMQIFQAPFVCFVIVLGIYIAIATLTIPESGDHILRVSFHVIMILNVAWIINRVLMFLISNFLLPYAAKSDNSLDINVAKAIQKVVAACIWVIAVITAFSALGIDIGAMLATLGIGGVAFALAAQDTIKNMFGGLTIFADRPFKLGQRIKVASYDGVVEEIGVRSTRIRTLEGRLVTIPNYKIVENEVENVSLEPSRKIVLKLGLEYNTTPEAMEEALAWLKGLPASIPAMKKDVIASFTDYGDFALGITFIYYIKSGSNVFETQSKVNLTILKYFNSKGWSFAFPTQTLYVQK